MRFTMLEYDSRRCRKCDETAAMRSLDRQTRKSRENIGTHGVIISVRRYLVAACVKNDGVRASFSHPRFRARGREKAAARRTLGSRRIRFETFAVAAVGHPAMHAAFRLIIGGARLRGS